jgi:hypothetical protein
MTTFSQGYREYREGSSPFREKSNKKDTALIDNQSNIGVRTRYDIPDP